MSTEDEGGLRAGEAQPITTEQALRDLTDAAHARLADGTPRGTFACPICGVGTPHPHSDAEQAAWRDDQARGDGWTSTILRTPTENGYYLCRGHKVVGEDDMSREARMRRAEDERGGFPAEVLEYVSQHFWLFDAPFRGRTNPRRQGFPVLPTHWMALPTFGRRSEAARPKTGPELAAEYGFKPHGLRPDVAAGLGSAEAPAGCPECPHCDAVEAGAGRECDCGTSVWHPLCPRHGRVYHLGLKAGRTPNYAILRAGGSVTARSVDVEEPK